MHMVYLGNDHEAGQKSTSMSMLLHEIAIEAFKCTLPLQQDYINKCIARV